MNALFIRSRTGNACHNLAVEEYLLENLPEGMTVLFVWQGDNAVVIGKHQNPWVETDGEFMTRYRITLSRRISGGGAVFQDAGNLNFSFIADRKRFDVHNQMGMVVKSIMLFGLPRVESGPRGFYLSGRKFSGSSYCIRHRRALHHGTLLVSCELGMMRALQGRMTVSPGKAVLSERAEMINLSEVSNSITVDDLADGLRDSWRRISGVNYGEAETGDLCRGDVFGAILEKRRGWDWRYGATPPCDVIFRSTTGSISLRINRGRVETVSLLPCGGVIHDFRGSVRLEPIELRDAFENSGNPHLQRAGDYIADGVMRLHSGSVVQGAPDKQRGSPQYADIGGS